MSITTNTVTGSGRIDYIAQNGIQSGYGASATVIHNTANDNSYEPDSYDACGILLCQVGSVKPSGNTRDGNEVATCGKGGDRGKSTA